MRNKSRTDAAHDLRNDGYVHLSDTLCLYYKDNKFTIESMLDATEGHDPTPLTAKQTLGYIRRHFDKYPVVYVNAYAVSRHYVHPAEGGIWEDCGEPLASVPVRDYGRNIFKETEIERAKFNLTEALADHYSGNRHRSSVIGGENFELYVEDHMAEPFPNTPYEYS